MPSGKKRKGHKMATHKRKKRLRKNRHKNKKQCFLTPSLSYSDIISKRTNIAKYYQY